MPGRRRQGGFGGTSSGLGTLQQSYNAAASSAAEGIVLDATRLGLIVKDSAGGVGGSLLSMQSNGGVKYFDISVSGGITESSPIANGATPAYVWDTVNVFDANYVLAWKNNGKDMMKFYSTGSTTQFDFFNPINGAGGQSFIHDYANGRFKLTGGLVPNTDLTGAALGSALLRWNGIFGTSLSSGGTQSLTITGSASSTWSLSAGSLTLSTTGAGNALSITAGDASSWTTSAGILTISGAGGMTIGAGGQQNQLRGGIQVNNRVTVNDAAYTANAYDCIIEYTALTANRTVTIPNAAAGNIGQIYIIKMGLAGGSVNKISTTTVGGVQLIDGAATYTPATGNSWSCYCLYSTGANWMVWAEKGSLT